MLQAIRERASGFIAWTIIGLICVVLVLTGGFEYFNTTPQDAVATVNGEEIALADFTQSFSRYRARQQAQAQSRMGTRLDPSFFDQPMIRRQHLDEMINSELRRQAAIDAGLAISPQRLAETISADPSFNVGGEFNTDQYRALLAQQGMTPTLYEADITKRLLEFEVFSTLSRSAFSLPSEVARAQRLRAQLRSFEHVKFDAANYRDQVTVSDEEIQAYYDENNDEFTTPERVVLEYVQLLSDQLQTDIDISDSTLQQRYEAQKGRFIIPERRRTSHILFEAPSNASAEQLEAVKSEAEAVAERIRAGESFEDLAREVSSDIGSAQEGGDLGWVEEGDMVAAFEQALFEMEAGQISEPVNTAFGFHLIWLREVEASRGKSFEEAREELAAEFRESEVERLYLEQQDRLYDLSYEDSGSLQGAADSLGLEVQTTEPVSRIGSPVGIAANPGVMKAAFSDQVLLEGSNSDPISISETETVVVRVGERLDAELNPLESVADDIREKVTSRKAQELAEQAADRLVAAALSSGSLAAALAADATLAPAGAGPDAAEDSGESASADESDTSPEADAEAEISDVVTALDVPRFGRPGEVTNSLARGVFEMPRPSADQPAFKAVVGQANEYHAVALLTVKDGQEAPAAADSVGDSLAFTLTQQEAAGTDAQLREEAEISVLEDRLQPAANTF